MITFRKASLIRTMSAAALAALCIPLCTPAYAMLQDVRGAREGEEVFVDLGRWVIVQDEAARACELRLSNDPRYVLRYRLSDGRAGMLALQRRSGRFFTGIVGDVEWAFDNTRFAGYQANNGYSLPAGARSVEAGFRAAKTLSVTHGGQPVAQIDLKTSSAGFRLLKQCSEQWRYIPWYRRLASAQYRDLPDAARTRDGRWEAGPSRPNTRPNTRPVARPNTRALARPGGVAPPLEPSRTKAPSLAKTLAPRPINPSSWIKNEDALPWPSRGFREGQGVLRYTLLVDEEGRAQDCDVEATTGSRKFDRRACQLLEERARFEPARGSDGKAIEARFTASVRFAGE